MVLNSWMFLTTPFSQLGLMSLATTAHGRTSACTRNSAANSASSEEPRARSSSLCASSRARDAFVVNGSAFCSLSKMLAAPGVQPAQNASSLTSGEHSSSATKHDGWSLASVAFVFEASVTPRPITTSPAAASVSRDQPKHDDEQTHHNSWQMSCFSHTIDTWWSYCTCAEFLAPCRITETKNSKNSLSLQNLEKLTLEISNTDYLDKLSQL